ncbi:MAG: hypothetical protein IKZ45_05090 [Fibrobacter sp.]|nr:hypothetical protein [Fibrobacter sp.]
MTEIVHVSPIELFFAKQHGGDKKKWSRRNTKLVQLLETLSVMDDFRAVRNVISAERRIIWKCTTRIILSR